MRKYSYSEHENWVTTKSHVQQLQSFWERYTKIFIVSDGCKGNTQRKIALFWLPVLISGLFPVWLIRYLIHFNPSHVLNSLINFASGPSLFYKHSHNSDLYDAYPLWFLSKHLIFDSHKCILRTALSKSYQKCKPNHISYQFKSYYWFFL